MLTYFHATRHPWSSFLFLLPLLAAYEGGVLWLGGDRAAALRNGADAWVRWQLELFGLGWVFAAPLIVLAVLLAWSWWRWLDRPADPVTTWFGMAFESGVFAVLLWQVSRNFAGLVHLFGVKLQIAPEPATQVLTYIGAGVYEEVLFRLGAFLGLVVIFRSVLLPKLIAVPLAAAGAAVLFAAAHHVGPYGEPMSPYVFLFRALAGLYFTGLFVGRGFGVAVGAHAGYDILVGVTLR
ncbi:MAG: CPBP family intramembrane metalloprotease [Gemmataceae bacterium]|nr:CPBP family intramembrane metalloprotease [Gemmataceae bacterium]